MGETKATLAPMAAKSRGAKIHPRFKAIRPSKPPRETTSWVRADKQYHAYSYFESPSNKPPLQERSGAPPKMWLPQSNFDRERLKAKAAAKAKEAAKSQSTAATQSPEKKDESTGQSFLDAH